MIFVAKLSGIVAVLYIVGAILYPIYKPLTKKQRKGTRAYFKEQQALKKKREKELKQKEFASKYLSGFLGNAERIRYKKIIDRLELDIIPEQIRYQQLQYVIIALIVAAVMMTANAMLGYMACIFIVLGWLYPISELEERIEKRNKNIAFDFPAFYSMLYYQYSKSVNLYLADVIKDFLPNANEDMKEELGVMIDNIEYGEEYALKQLKKRIPLHYIIKFCDIMETRLKGYDNTTQMTFLKNELDEFRILNLEKELENRKNANERIQYVLVGILGIYIIIYYLFMVLTSLKMFE